MGVHHEPCLVSWDHPPSRNQPDPPLTRHHGEVAPVEGEDARIATLGAGHHRRVRQAEWQVRVAGDQLADAGQVGLRGFERECLVDQVVQEGLEQHGATEAGPAPRGLWGWRHNLHGMGEPVAAEVRAVDCQDARHRWVAVDEVEDHGVDVGEAVVAVPGEDGPGVAVGGGRDGESAERPRVLVDHREDGQRDARVAPRADAPVVAKLGEGLTDDGLGNEEWSSCLAGGNDVADGPAVVAIAAVDGRDEKTAVGERCQGP